MGGVSGCVSEARPHDPKYVLYMQEGGYAVPSMGRGSKCVNEARPHDPRMRQKWAATTEYRTSRYISSPLLVSICTQQVHEKLASVG